jgi:hypothetical protein
MLKKNTAAQVATHPFDGRPASRGESEDRERNNILKTVLISLDSEQ